MNERHKEAPTLRDLRRFGLVVGGIFAVLGAAPALRRHPPRFWMLLLGAALALAGLLIPRSLGLLYRAWLKAGELLGWVNSRVLLTLIFYGIVTPMGLLRRLFGKDPMRRTKDVGTDSYRLESQPRPSTHLFRQF